MSPALDAILGDAGAPAIPRTRWTGEDPRRPDPGTATVRDVTVRTPEPGMTTLEATDTEIALTIAPGVRVVLDRNGGTHADTQYAYLQRLMSHIGAARQMVHHPQAPPESPHPGT